MRGLARRNGDQGAFEHLHAEQRAFECGEALAERARAADAAAPGNEGTALADAGLADEGLGVEPELGDGVAGLQRAGVDGGEQMRRKGFLPCLDPRERLRLWRDRKSTRLNSSH